MPTFCELAGVKNYQKRYANKKLKVDYFDGISFAPTLLGQPQPKKHAHLYWEFSETNQIGVRMGDWKMVVIKGIPHLYDLSKDLHEDHDVAAEHPEIVRRMTQIIQEEHVDSPLFPVTLPTTVQASENKKQR